MADTARPAHSAVEQTALSPQTESYRAATRLIERLHRLYLDVIRAELDRLGVEDLSAVQALLLANIGTAELNVKTLMERGYYQGSNASYNLKKLVEAGYIEQFRSSHDRRATIVRLTEQGLDLCRRIDASEEQFATSFGSDATHFTEMVARMTELERGWTDQIRFGPGV
ncbi:MAG: winged helix DNA-binding protein [Minwuia sp.]|nr:winged helix DNA-binding protein [Minwuia sp.]